MSLLNEQIKQNVQGRLVYHDKDETLNAKIKFNEDFIGFDGHFSDSPVLPGVVMIRVIMTMFELFKGREYRLLEIKKTKFSEPVSSGENVIFSVKADEHSDVIKLSGKVVKSEKTVAKISLVIQIVM